MLTDFTREETWQAALHERDQRDQVTQKVRFGLVILNGASLATVLSASSLLGNLPEAILAFSATCFVLGVAAAGWAVESHQRHLITSAGRWAARAMKYDRLSALIALSRGSIGESDTQEKIEKLLSELSQETKTLFEPDTSSIWKQFASRALWLAGALSIVVQKIFSLV